MLECKICNYKTDRMTNYKKHLDTQKHIKNLQDNKHKIIDNASIFINNSYNDNKYVCEICNREFEKKCNLIRHKSSHQNDNNKIDSNNTKKIINKVEEINTNINKNITENNQRIEKKIDNAVKSASALIRYLLEYHKNAPVLKALENDELIEALKITHNVKDTQNNKNNQNQQDSDTDSEENNLSISEDDLDDECKTYYRKYKKNMIKLREEKKIKKQNIKKILDDPNKFILQKEIIKDYKSGSFTKYISDTILKNIKKDDITIQSVFNTDYSRLNYAIKISKRKWDEDKAGSKFIELVITPTLTCINNLLEEYRTDLSNKHDNSRYNKDINDTEEFKSLLQNIFVIYEIQAKIMANSTIKMIIKELAPSLRFIIDEDKNKEINKDDINKEIEIDKI
jgi:hypothetical protein